MRGMDGGIEQDDDVNFDPWTDEGGELGKQLLELNLENHPNAPITNSISQIFQGLIGSYEMRNLLRPIVMEILREGKSGHQPSFNNEIMGNDELFAKRVFPNISTNRKVDVSQMKERINDFSLLDKVEIDEYWTCENCNARITNKKSYCYNCGRNKEYDE